MSDKNTNYLWITWEIQRRNRSLSTELSAQFIEIVSNRHRIIRYLTSIYKTLASIRRYRPEILFVQNPSLMLALLAVIYHKITKLPVVVDAHNAGIFPPVKDQSILSALTKYVLKNTPLTIVTNHNLAEYVTSIGGRATVLPDPLPEISNDGSRKILKGRINVLFICTWANDEPYQNVIEAGRLVDRDIFIYITGNSKGKELAATPLPENVILTGFVSEADFISMLFNCDLILDLTTREDCLVCGAYESLAANRAMILSDTRALKNYFKNSALYTDNSIKNIADQIMHASKCISQLEAQSIKEKINIVSNWQQQFSIFRDHLKRL